MINVIININKIIIRNANLLFIVKKFSKEFANILITSLIDFFFDYNQMTLVKKCRNSITFIISLEFLRII